MGRHFLLSEIRVVKDEKDNISTDFVGNNKYISPCLFIAIITDVIVFIIVSVSRAQLFSWKYVNKFSLQQSYNANELHHESRSLPSD